MPVGCNQGTLTLDVPRRRRPLGRGDDRTREDPDELLSHRLWLNLNILSFSVLFFSSQKTQKQTNIVKVQLSAFAGDNIWFCFWYLVNLLMSD